MTIIRIDSPGYLHAAFEGMELKVKQSLSGGAVVVDNPFFPERARVAELYLFRDEYTKV